MDVESGESIGEIELWWAKGAEGIKRPDDGFISAEAPDVIDAAPLLPPDKDYNGVIAIQLQIL